MKGRNPSSRAIPNVSLAAPSCLYGAVNLRLAVEPDAVAAVPIVHHHTVTMSDLPRGGRCVADVWF